ncbi:hypothetical protein ACW9UR_05330 [Halovulum sp. GXIMD14794]
MLLVPMWTDLMMAARIFHTPDIAELEEALEDQSARESDREEDDEERRALEAGFTRG